MGQQAAKIPPRPPVAAGKTRICIAGYGISHHTNRAGRLARAIVDANPDKYESWFYFNTKGYPELLSKVKTELSASQQKEFAAHKTAPFCWLELPDGRRDAKGGRDKLCEWVIRHFTTQRYDEALEIALLTPTLTELWVDSTPGTAPGQKDEE
eukprot:TRINITY_DN44962_c0_g1_i1.p1 TRINITY_DN44962_c0_g1~~TRINITY_DN44962_c0_g1_i1.p1  ORF type:complete len:153 (-),score=29.13 TRINITY_DN44962_c0_g1_i1:11-469(-)